MGSSWWGWFVLVDHVFCQIQLRCPLWVVGISVRYLVMLSAISSGQDERNPALISESSVALGGEKGHMHEFNFMFDSFCCMYACD